MVRLGEEIKLNELKNNMSRRELFKNIGKAGLTIGGLKEAIDTAFGKQHEGVPIVWTYDIYGNPERIRMIPKERYRRLMVYEKLDPRKFTNKYPFVDEISITQRSSNETDLAIVLSLNEKTPQTTSELPYRIEDVPVIREERPTSGHPKSCDSTTSSCSANSTNNNCRVGDSFSTIRGNVQITNGTYGGTLGLVAWNSDSSNPYKVLITADHTMEASSEMYHPKNGRKIGNYQKRDQAMDTTRYILDSDDDGNPRETVEPSQNDISGTWTHDGLTDAVNYYDYIECSFAGAETCYCTTRCNSTSKNEGVIYEADMREVVTEAGDSGGPFVDSDGKLVCTLYGCQESGGVYWDRGPTGDELLYSVDAQLYNPSLN